MGAATVCSMTPTKILIWLLDDKEQSLFHHDLHVLAELLYIDQTLIEPIFEKSDLHPGQAVAHVEPVVEGQNA